uniref:Uncharacterized protein n=1 Tax=Naja naja TaxID=35670 RepID=A0A8C6VIA1_NAJNA
SGLGRLSREKSFFIFHPHDREYLILICYSFWDKCFLYHCSGSVLFHSTHPIIGNKRIRGTKRLNKKLHLN